MKSRICKLIIFTLVILSLITSMNPVVGFASSEFAGDTEIVGFLNSVGISAIESSDYITRKDFVVMIVEASGAVNSAGVGSFNDVDGDAADYISTAKALGYIKGDSNGQFNPDDVIRYDDAMLICLRVLGFENCVNNDADRNRFVRTLNLADKLNYTELLSCDQANIIIFNMLNSHYAVSDYAEDETVHISDDYFMNDRLDLYKLNGRVTAVSGISIVPTAFDLDEDEICIDNIVYKNECVMDYDYIGSDIVFYMKKYEDYKSVVFFNKTQVKDSVEKISANDIVSVKGFNKDDSKYEKSSPYIECEGTNSRLKKIYLSPSSLVYVNGNGVVGVTNEVLIPKSGYVKVLSSNGKNNDIIIVEDYLYYRVDAVSEGNEIISDAGDNPTIYLDRFDNYTIKHSDGKAAALTDIKKDSLLAVAATVNNNQIDTDAKLTIEIMNSGFSGKVEKISYRDNYVTVSGKQYEFSEDVSDNLNIDSEGVFYLGKNDEIVIFVNEVSDRNYGFLMKIGTDGVLNRSAKMIIYDAAGKKYKLSFDDRTKVKYTGMLNDSYVTNTQIGVDTFLELFNEPQLVVFKANEDNITHIEKAVDCSSQSDYIGYDEDRFTIDYSNNNGRIYSVWVAQNYNFKKNAKLFVTKKNAENDEDIVVADYSYLGQDVKGLNIKLYDSTKKFEVPIALVTVDDIAINPGGSFALEKNIALIQGQFSAIDNDGNEYKGYNAYCKGQLVKLIPKFDDLKDTKSTMWNGVTGKKFFSELEAGDIIQYGLDASGKVNVIHILHSKSSDTDEYITYNDYDYASEMSTAYGKVMQFVPESFFSLSSSESRKFPFARPIIGQNGVKMYVYVYYQDRGLVTTSSSLDYLEDGEKVFVRTARADVTDIVIYR